MPELPEVEIIRRGLARRIIGKRIVAVEVLDKKIVKSANFERALKDDEIVSPERRGKLLMFKLRSGHYLLVHLKMTGQLIYQNHRIVAGGHSLTENDLKVPNKFTRLVIFFADKSRLYFNDMRRFGYMKIAAAKEKEKIVKDNYGIEPLTPDFKLADFAKFFKKRKTSVKALLMNQKLISGLGNIYADEACFCARLLPWRPAVSLKPMEIKRLFKCIALVLEAAIKNRGTTFSRFVDIAGRRGGNLAFLNVYERDGQKCRRCGGVIRKIRHAGRGTHYCPGCQK